MPLTTGSRLSHYEILGARGAGGMSACGHAEPRTSKSEARHQRQNALGVPAFAKATARSRRSSQAKSRAEAEGPSASEEMLTPSPCR
jgi:hypothetical protein